MLNMTTDSKRFCNRRELETVEGAWPVGSSRFESADGGNGKGSYRSRDLCLAWINALMAGQPDGTVAR
jgi:hypothetical protein